MEIDAPCCNMSTDLLEGTGDDGPVAMSIDAPAKEGVCR
jgi:hypothetical protein